MRLLLILVAIAAMTAGEAQAWDQDPYDDMPGAILLRTPREPVPCVVELKVKGRKARRGDSVVLTASARNRTNRPVTLVLPDECGGGPVRFLGIRPEYDFQGGCNRGACVKGAGQVRITIGPRATRNLGRVTIKPSGDTCNPPVKPGRYPIAAHLQFQQDPVEVCIRPGYELVVPTPPTRPRPAPVQRPTQPPARDPALDRCPRPEPCALHCPHGYDTTLDADGCPRSCSCAPHPLHVPSPTPTRDRSVD